MGDIKDWFSTHMLPSSSRAHLSTEDGMLEPHLPDLSQLRFQMRVQCGHSDVLLGNLESKSEGRPYFPVTAPSSASKAQEALGSSTMVLAQVPTRRGQPWGHKEAGLGHPPTRVQVQIPAVWPSFHQASPSSTVSVGSWRSSITMEAAASLVV